MSEREPRVSIIIATYNRPGVLRYAIESVLAQTVDEWELLVIGDSCTDDTATVVAGFDDARISFFNLPQNHGEQSGPNNEGLRRARGRYIAFLNHDDLWFPDHLETALEGLEAEDVSFVHTLGIVMHPDGMDELIGASRSGYWHPCMSTPASLWVFRREVFAKLGPWRSAWRIWNQPSQDWLYRAWRLKIRIAAIPKVTACILRSGERQDSYAHDQSGEHDHWLARIRNEAGLRESVCGRIAVQQAALENEPEIGRRLKLLLKGCLFRIALLLHIAPYGMMMFFRFGRRGGLIKRLRRVRGLPPHNGRQR